MPEPSPRGAEATLGATASPLGQPSGSCGLPEKARNPPQTNHQSIKSGFEISDQTEYSSFPDLRLGSWISFPA